MICLRCLRGDTIFSLGVIDYGDGSVAWFQRAWHPVIAKYVRRLEHPQAPYSSADDISPTTALPDF